MDGSKRLERRLAAIFAADVAGYSRLMEQDEVWTLRALTTHREVMDRLIVEHGGRIANTAGDSVLAEFPSAVDAVQCAVEVQKALGTPGGSGLRFRIGVHVGDVMVRGGDLLGDGVNIAARLEGLAEPGGVCISGDAHRQVRKALPLSYADLGLQQVKNIEEPIHVYAVQTVKVPPAPIAAEQPSSKPLPLPDKPSIAVLPFTNMSGDPEQEYFADGVVEDIITALSRVRWFFVIARNSSFAYKHKAADIQQVGRELGVRYVMEGSIRKAGNRVRITGQLIEAATGRHVWADKFDGPLEDIFELQDRITQSVVGSIEPSLRRLEIERAQSKPTLNQNAYDLYLRALPNLYSFSDEGLRLADDLLRQAVNIDVNYSDAWAGIANVAFNRQVGGWIPLSEGQRIGREAALRAVKTDPENPSALAIAAATLAIQGGNFQQAVSFADRAVDLNPNSSEVLAFCGIAYNFNGDTNKALDILKIAHRLSPLDPRSYMIFNQTAHSYFFSRCFEEAAEWAARAVEENTRFTPARRYLAASLAHLGRIEEAQQVIAGLLIVQPNSRLSLSRTNTYRHPWMIALFVEGLRLAGLPE